MPNYKQFPLADTAEGLTEAEILSWRVQPGDEVTVNQIVVEIETAKAAVELPIPWAGVITELHVEPGQTVEVGTPILTVDTDPGGAPAAPSGNGSAPAAEAPAEEEMKPLVGYGSKTTVAKRRARKDTTPAPVATAAPAPAPGGYVPLAKPPVRKLAKDLGVDLHALAGTAGGGVITREDVQRAAAPAPAEPVESISGVLDERRVPIRSVRKATAKAMVQSAFTAPHVTEFLTLDVTPMMELRDKLKKTPAFAGIKLTPLAFAAKAVCLAVKRTPDVNALWDEDAQEIIYKNYVHLGIAAATPRGLIVPKVRNAERQSLAELAGSLEQLTNTAREGKTPPEDMVGGTFTITNVGVFGVDTGTPIITPGESAILALGAIRDTPWVVDGEIVVRKVMQLSLSFDHRVIDGQQGSQFLADVGALLSDPATAFLF
ncbi:dihydrolipoamide acetyltransferase family protein [Amycolatopsis suaedae]|uniref:Dihydrolipoamide acetyltransferase component of pyruvate dehydrogenase complex n=1 Tax=Amycolatopsis suaedae TaxID=2510978 RepID=A0A4Q7JBD3_9PSEU|nr:dihydrolipoamide acetyltransferase family protein [Amycolatopsis suaedae]RZQ65130.1 2-oxo acid dehydrogenase subunit E2 [Amycolatopsis suaedae]